MTDEPIESHILAELRRFDTPTVCNALDIILPGGTRNFTNGGLLCAFPKLPPMVGYGRTATMRGTHPDPRSRDEILEHKWAYWTYLSQGPSPGVSVVQDLDGDQAGYAAIWGEVNSTIHK